MFPAPSTANAHHRPHPVDADPLDTAPLDSEPENTGHVDSEFVDTQHVICTPSSPDA